MLLVRITCYLRGQSAGLARIVSGPRKLFMCLPICENSTYALFNATSKIGLPVDLSGRSGALNF